MWDRPQSAHHTGSSNGDQRYTLGRYRVTVKLGPEVPDEDRVTFSAMRYGEEQKSPISFEDGQFKIELSDLVELALQRSTPVEIAAWLWTNAEVRGLLVEQMVASWSDKDWDADRVALLKGCNQAITAHRLNDAADVLRSAEYYERKYWELYHALQHYMSRTPRTELLKKDRPEFLPPVTLREEHGEFTSLAYVQEDPEHRIGSKNWDEAKDWWRAKLCELVGIGKGDLPS